MIDTARSRTLLPYGDHAWLLECADLADSQAVHRWLAEQRRPEIGEIVPGARTLLLRLRAPLPADLLRTMIDIDLPPVDGTVSEMITIDVQYDGADLEPLADRLGIGVEEIVAHHTDQPWTVAFCGFSP